jgi:DNA polymerase
MAPSKQERIKEITTSVKNLKASPLYDYRQENDYSPVIGEGNLDAKIMFIGEAPGKQEAESGRPFVGAAGRILDELLDSIGLDREDVYITNVVKDRPPDNRDPHVKEIKLYKPFLIQQIDIIQPQVIVTLGRFAMNFILEEFDMDEQGQKISELHGQTLQTNASYGTVSVLPLYHPAVTFYGQDRKKDLEADFQKLKQFIE